MRKHLTSIVAPFAVPALLGLSAAVGCSSNDSSQGTGADAGGDSGSCSSGAFAWATAGGGSGQENVVRGVAIDKDGNTWVSGTFIGQAKWGTTTLTSSDSTHAVTFFAKLDPAGNVLFARTLDSPIGNLADGGGRIRVDAQGNAYIVGTFELSLTIDGVTLVQYDTMGGGAAFVIKVDPTGKALWGVASANIGGSDESGRDVAIDPSNGDVYLVGSYNGQAYFYNPGPGDAGDGGTPAPAVTTTAATGGEEKAYIAKFSQTSMTWQWAKGWIGTDNDGGIAHAVIVNPINGTVTVFGDINTELTVEGTNFAAAGGTFVATLAKSDGHLVWATEIDPKGGTALVHGAAVDLIGNIYAAGEFASSATFDLASTFAPADGGTPGDAGATPITLTPSGGTDAFLVKYDASGVPLWAKHGGSGTGATRADDVALDGQDGLYISGFTQSATFDSKTFSHTGSLFVARYDTTGAIQWLAGNDGQEGEANGLSVASPTGGISVGGRFTIATTLGSLQVSPIGTDTGLVTHLCN
jgi:hypothetical protein